MQRITGIGGIFFRSDNPKELTDWYVTHLGLDMKDDGFWSQPAGLTVFAPFKRDTDYFGRLDQQWMINFRVADMDAMIAQLEGAGIEVETRADWDSEIGRFARLHDPEGNPIELWEPSQNC